jgi:hypothetical protein
MAHKPSSAEYRFAPIIMGLPAGWNTGDETRWRRLPASSKDAPRQMSVIIMLHAPGIQTEEGLVEDKVVLCDCHCAAMYHTAVSIMPERGFVMCWASDCGRYYNHSLGYFHLRTTAPTTLEHIDTNTRRMTRCQSESCKTGSSMAITHSDDATGDKGKTCWYCFECGTELPYSIPRVLRGGPPRSSEPVEIADGRHRRPAKLWTRNG